MPEQLFTIQVLFEENKHNETFYNQTQESVDLWEENFLSDQAMRVHFGEKTVTLKLRTAYKLVVVPQEPSVTYG